MIAPEFVKVGELVALGLMAQFIAGLFGYYVAITVGNFWD